MFSSPGQWNSYQYLTFCSVLKYHYRFKSNYILVSSKGNDAIGHHFRAPPIGHLWYSVYFTAQLKPFSLFRFFPFVSNFLPDLWNYVYADFLCHQRKLITPVSCCCCNKCENKRFTLLLFVHFNHFVHFFNCLHLLVKAIICKQSVHLRDKLLIWLYLDKWSDGKVITNIFRCIHITSPPSSP